ncbi:uncharacterized protein LOC110985028 isoform X2 [Acanthaster planci]|nr:uncharacterized protein LOC110985028 isoform X2 [Acanthaster planci]
MASRMTGAKNSLLGYTRERFLPKATSGSSIPVILDDAEPNAIRGLMTKYFNGGVDATCSFESTPKCCPIISANWFALSKLAGSEREMTRAVIIPFLKTERRRSEDQFQAESRRHELEDVAVHCLPLLVSIASDLKKEKSHILQKCRVFVARILSHLSDADDRLHLTYGILLFVAQLLLQKANIEKLGPEQAETFLQTTVMKYGIEQFQVGNAMLNGLPSPTKTIADMAKLIIEAVQVCHIGELLTAVNPRVDVGGTIGLAFHLVTLLNILFAHGIDHPSKDICRQAISADPMMSGVQVYLNVERHHDIISRGGVKATGPRNRRGIWMPYSRFSQTQLREIESVFQIQTGTGAQVHVIGMQEDIQRNAEERSERGEENNAEDVMETDVEMVDVSDPVEKNSTELNETKEHREPAGPVTLESAHRKLFVDETQSSTASTNSTFEEPSSASTSIAHNSQRDAVNEAEVARNKKDRASRKRKYAETTTTQADGPSTLTLNTAESQRTTGDEGFCRTCLRTAPQRTKSRQNKKIKWISCGNCCGWFHQECLGMNLSNKEAEDLVFTCSKCSD